MTLNLQGWLFFVSVPIIAWIIGVRTRKSGTWRGYFLASGKLGTTSVMSAYVGANLTFTTIVLILSEEGFKRGVWTFAVPLFWLVGTAFLLLCYPRMKPFIIEGMTLHQVLARQYEDVSLQRWASVWTIIAFVGTVALEFYGGIKLCQWAGVPLLANVSLALLLAFIVSSFTAMGGFRGVAYSDIFMDGVALVGIGVIFYHTQPVIAHLGRLDLLEGPAAPNADNLMFVAAMAILFIPFQLCTLDSWQRLGAWHKNQKSPAGMLGGGGLLLAVVYSVPVLVGMAARSLSLTGPGHPLKNFLEFAHLGPIMLGVVFAGFIAAVLSTADELLNCCSLSLLFDVFRISRTGQTPSEEVILVASGRFWTQVFGFAAAIIALLAIQFEREISDLALAVFSAQVVFTVPLLVGLFRPASAPRMALSAKASMLVGFVSALAFVALGWATGDRTYSDAAPVVAFVLGLGVFCLVPLAQWLWHRVRREKVHS